MVASRRPLMAGNWKMYKTREGTAEYLDAFLNLVADVDDREILLGVPFTALVTALDLTQGTNVRIGAQSMHYADEGAFTGEVSPAMLVDVGVPWVILGHSERRQYYAETDAELAKKVRSALDHGLHPVLCIGETLEEREAGSTREKVEGQLRADLADVKADELARMAVAYEPIWAIGTGRTATPDMAQETIGTCRQVVRDLFGGAAEWLRLLYGGSVKAANIDDLMAQPDIDGVLVGGASLDPQEFARIVKFQTA